MDNFDPYSVLLAIATNIPQRLKTAFVLQGHIFCSPKNHSVKGSLKNHLFLTFL